MKRSSGKDVRGSGGFSKLVVALFLGLLVSVTLALSIFFHVSQADTREEAYLIHTAEQGVLSGEIAKYALLASSANSKAFAQLRDSRDLFQQRVTEMKAGSPELGLPPIPMEVNAEFVVLDDIWMELRQNADDILSRREAILATHDFINVITGLLPKLEELSRELLNMFLQKEGTQAEIVIASRQLVLIQRIDKNVPRVLVGGKAAEAIDRISRDAGRFGSVLQGMMQGSSSLKIEKIQREDAVQKLKEVSMLFGIISNHAMEIVDISPELLPALQASGSVAAVSDRMNKAAFALMEALGKSPGRFVIAGIKTGQEMMGIFGAMALFFFISLIYFLLRDAKQREMESYNKNERNQHAILQLLDEMGNLADGDLTVIATVTEDMTGVIADSINYSIGALRQLVTTINQTSEQVSSSAEESRFTTMQLTEASEHQAEQITSATQAIKGMAKAIEQISNDAAESAKVAKQSVEIADKGTGTVRRTIEGMDTIREQIQETSKRIKRLGESSQQIGDIVAIIDDIADQTNILALNAAMQAAMAGEAGRGFAVVADEVQRLAERSGNATKQIEALVKTIQADTNEAARSMEASTTEVVAGAALAEDAGEVLKEIENVSNHIAEVTGKIADSAQDQSSEVTLIDDTMSVIQEITAQTLEGANRTATSVGILADMAGDLQQSVAGFSLPE